MDPILAANVLFGIWEALHSATTESEKEPTGGLGQATCVPGVDERNYIALKERIDKLVLVVHAMWSVLAEKMGVTEADLLKRIAELDAADGTVDGRVLKPPFRCSCGAMVSHRLKRCVFCGKRYDAGAPFETL